MSIRSPKKASNGSKRSKKAEKVPFYEMSPSQRVQAEKNYEDWINNQTGRTDLLVSNTQDMGLLDEDKALELISNIQKYLRAVEMTGEKISGVEDLETRLFDNIFENVEDGSDADLMMTSIRESVYKTSGYYCSLFTLRAIDKVKKDETKPEETTIDDHIGEQEDTSDKEVSSKKVGR